jgi:predicted MFS family arabinose efflux permease
VAAAFLINSLSYVAFLLALARIRIAPGETETVAPGRSFMADLAAGIRYTATHPGIGALMVLLIAFGVGGRPMTELLPGLADDVFHAGAGGLSILASAVGGGAILGGVWLGHRAHASDLMTITLAAAFITALAATASVATENLWLALPAVVVFGFGMSTAGIASQTLVQLASDRSMRGRVMGLYGLIFRGGPAIGALGAGLVSVHLGLRWPVVIGAVLVLVACLWAYLRRDRIAAALRNKSE